MQYMARTSSVNLNDATELLSTKEARHDYLAYVMCVCVTCFEDPSDNGCSARRHEATHKV